MGPLILSIEGNIGSGKSTLVKNLQDEYKANKFCQDLKIHFLQEPVSIWETIKDTSGRTILENYYADLKKYAFSFQMMAYISRLALLKEAMRGGYDIIITERCIFTDQRVFAKMLYDSQNIGEIEYKIYNLWFYEFIRDFPEFNIIYVKTRPDVANERVLSRGRAGETIQLEYLNECHKYHENWLNNIDPTKLLILDGNIVIDMNDHDDTNDAIKTSLLILQNRFNIIENFIRKQIETISSISPSNHSELCIS
jgi:deoxyguanosine kinase